MLNKATKLEFSCKTCPSLLWDILNKATKFEFFSPSASFALQFDDFVPRDRSAAKGPLTLAVVVEHSDHCVTPRRAKLQNSGPYLRIHRSQLVWLYSCNHCQAKGAPKKIQTQRLRCLVLLSTAEQNEPQKTANWLIAMTRSFTHCRARGTVISLHGLFVPRARSYFAP